MTSKQLNVGDVFTIPIDDARHGLGQIVGRYGKDAYYFAIFDALHRRGEQVDWGAASRAPIAFLALSLDAKLAAGHWTIVGREPVSAGLALPAYKEIVGSPDNVEVVDYSGQRRRRATPEEARQLSSRKVVAPVRLEKALRAKHGLEPWNDAYGELIPRPETSAAKLFGDA